MLCQIIKSVPAVSSILLGPRQAYRKRTALLDLRQSGVVVPIDSSRAIQRWFCFREKTELHVPLWASGTHRAQGGNCDPLAAGGGRRSTHPSAAVPPAARKQQTTSTVKTINRPRSSSRHAKKKMAIYCFLSILFHARFAAAALSCAHDCGQARWCKVRTAIVIFWVQVRIF